jgi:flagellar L-ring protein FlgH
VIHIMPPLRSISILSTACIVLLCAACAAVEPVVTFPPDSGVGRADNTLGRQSDRDWDAEKKRQAELFQAALASSDKQRPGSIYAKSGFRSIYEDVKAKFVGDMVVVELVENTQAQQSKSTSVSRDDTASIGIPSIGRFRGLNGTASGSKNFDGDGSTSASNLLTGVVTTRVIEVLPNGYLRVAGEKKIGVNRQVETVRFYGIVDPFSIRPGNRVLSNQIADARIEYTGEGTIDTVQMMGWLSRIFLSVLPF